MRGLFAKLVVARSLRHAAAGTAMVAALAFALAGMPARALGQRAEAAASDSDVKRYRQVIEDAVAEFELGHWEEAVVLFREAHALRPSAKTHRGLGQALFEARDYVHAIPHLRSALEAPVGTFSPEEYERLERALNQAMRFVGRIDAIVDPPDAVVRVDGAAVVEQAGSILLNPGKHLIVVSADGYLPYQQLVDVEGSSTRTLQIALVRAEAVGDGSPSSDGDTAEPSSAAGGDPTLAQTREERSGSSSEIPLALGWASAGLAVAGIGTGVVLWRLRDDGPAADWETHDCVTIPRLDDTCQDLESQADGLATASLISTIAGGAFAVVSVVMFVVAAGDDSEESRSAAGIRCGVGPGALACAGRF